MSVNVVRALLQQLGSFPVHDDLGPPVLGEIVKARSRRQATEDRDLVRSARDPAKLIETAQHAVRALPSIVASPHLLAPDPIVGLSYDGPGAGRRDGNQFAPVQLSLTTEDDLDWTAVSHVHIRKPNECPSWVESNLTNLGHNGSDDADDH